MYVIINKYQYNKLCTYVINILFVFFKCNVVNTEMTGRLYIFFFCFQLTTLLANYFFFYTWYFPKDKHFGARIIYYNLPIT